MNPENIIGIIAGVCTTAAAIPQLVKSIKTKEVTGVSPFMFIVLIVGLSLWTAYGIMRKDFPLIVTNGISVLLNSTVLVLFFVYKGKGGEEEQSL
ncbi:SemiSWEET transporter [soil metagenome]